MGRSVIGIMRRKLDKTATMRFDDDAGEHLVICLFLEWLRLTLWRSEWLLPSPCGHGPYYIVESMNHG